MFVGRVEEGMFDVRAKEQEQYLAAVRQLAHETGAPEDSVLSACAFEFNRLSEDAVIKQFISLLALKHVKEKLARHSNHEK
ncbi:MAG TPA: DUF3562 domain-containing protein [Burkholderiaceae bacterium]|nr:DUF3562 domain-containing protein [Burkholderiaceae bacterium]